MDFLEAQNYLEKVRSQKGIVLGLDTMRHLMAKLNNPQDKVKFIQVAGTNGKGSTAAYLTSIRLQGILFLEWTLQFHLFSSLCSPWKAVV